MKLRKTFMLIIIGCSIMCGCSLFTQASKGNNASEKYVESKPQIILKDTARNLVINPSFEQMDYCPFIYSSSITDTFACKDWLEYGSVDYYTPCAKDTFFLSPYNGLGYCPPHSGKSYIGEIPLDTYGGAEYVEGKLKRPLKAGKRYAVSFWVRTTKKTLFYTNNIGLKFLTRSKKYYQYYDAKVNLFNSSFDIKMGDSADIRNNYNRYLTNWDKWVEISGVYTAQGGENGFVIGSFWNNNHQEELFKKKKEKYIKKFYLKKLKKHILAPSLTETEAYIFIDDVYIWPLNEQKE